MPWKTEIDRLVHHLVLDAGQGGSSDVKRAVRTVADLNQLAPDRGATMFHVGALHELVEARAARDEGEEDTEDRSEWLEGLPASSTEDARRWAFLGRLDAASRTGPRDRVRGLMDDAEFEASLDHPEGRVALRAVGRMLLRDGEADRAFDLYRRHLAAVTEEGSRRDAEFLLEESLRRADRGEHSQEQTMERLNRAATFAAESGLDARACSKVDRKIGRLQQLAGNWDEATERYREALDRLPEDDPYRSVLVGDLALATLGVRGTLDLLPQADRERREEAQAILEKGQAGEGRSYNAIYTQGMLAYESGDFDAAAACFREADQLMRENRAKARIVHARSRFFLGHCLLTADVEGDDLDQAQRWVLRNANAVSLDPEIKGPVFDKLVEHVPNAKIPGRPTQRAAASPSRPLAPEHLEAARAKIEEDPHGALALVDKAFKSRPDFETWFGAYQTRLEALIALGEKDEALRTYERFRAKLYQREALERLETFLLDKDGPAAALFDDAGREEQLADLYEVMPDREQQFVDVCRACAERHIATGEPHGLARAYGLLAELSARGTEDTDEALAAAKASAMEAGVLDPDVDREETKSLLKDEEEPVRILVVGGDTARKPTLDAFNALAKELGFEGEWVFTGLRPPYKTLREIANEAQDADVVLLHHAVGPDMRGEVKRLGEKYDVPVRDAAWLGAGGLERELLFTLKDAFVD